MESAAAKRARAVRGSAPDRLSALSDELLCRVLSFLPSRQAVQTTVLSKRWMDLWRSVPAINISWRDLGGGGGFTVSDYWWGKLQDFATNLLMLHNAPRVDAFRLDLFCSASFLDWLHDVERWIRRGIKCQPTVLQICVYRQIFKYHLQIPGLGSEFRRLKSLELRGVYLEPCFSERLSSGCPVLEDLVLRYCNNDFAAIRSDTLKNLVLCSCTNRCADTMVVRAPCLASMSLDLTGYRYNYGLSLESVNALVTASISVVSSRLYPGTEANLLGSVFNVASLELRCFQARSILDDELDMLPTFDNLRTLSLKWCFLSERDADKFKALGRFLHKSPNLEGLILQDFWYSEGTPRMWPHGDQPDLKTVRPVVGPIEFPMLENLRTLFLDNCDLRDNFRILRHLLRRSPNLEKLTVRCCELPKASMGRKGKNKLKKTYSGFRNLVCFQCPKLKSTEIMYKGAKIQELVSFLLDISGSATMNSIKLTKV